MRISFQISDCVKKKISICIKDKTVFIYILLSFFIIFIVKFVSKIKIELALRAEDQKRMSKPDDELIGEYF